MISQYNLPQVSLDEVLSAPDLQTQVERILENGSNKKARCEQCQEALRQADIQGQGLNPECLKETCRLCKEPNHILHCNENEQSGQKDMRTSIEAQMSEVMIRTCWKCKKRIYKTEGCNKITCACGAHMCYVCREPIKDYSHFTGTGDCPHDSDECSTYKGDRGSCCSG